MHDQQGTNCYIQLLTNEAEEESYCSHWSNEGKSTLEQRVEPLSEPRVGLPNWDGGPAGMVALLG